VYKQILINARLKAGNRGQKTELTGRRSFRMRSSEVDCSANEEEEEEDLCRSFSGFLLKFSKA
jgi:hypothetical protein